MTRVLLPTQSIDAKFLADEGRNPRRSLFSLPGTGKTLTALEAVRIANPTGKLVVIAPKIALRMWSQEIQDWLGMSCHILAAGKTEIDYSVDAYVTTYGLASTFKDKIGGPEVLILDEADALKSLSAARTKAIYGARASGKNAFMTGCRHVWPLTGTPVRRYHDDLYPWFKALHPQVLKDFALGNQAAFEKAFCRVDMRRYHPSMPMRRTVVGSINEAELNRLIYRNGLAVRRTIDDVAADMPPMVQRTIDVDLDWTPELKAETVKWEHQDDPENVFSTTTLRRLLGVSKVTAVGTYVIDCFDADKSPLLCLYWHSDVGSGLLDYFGSAGLRAAKIDGSSSDKARQLAEDRFNGGEIDVLLGQMQAMGVALNLQKASTHVVFAERDWSSSTEEQAYKRVWRLGQKNKVRIDYCVSNHPLDEVMGDIVDRKTVSQRKTMGDV